MQSATTNKKMKLNNNNNVNNKVAEAIAAILKKTKKKRKKKRNKLQIKIKRRFVSNVKKLRQNINIEKMFSADLAMNKNKKPFLDTILELIVLHLEVKMKDFQFV